MRVVTLLIKSLPTNAAGRRHRYAAAAGAAAATARLPSQASSPVAHLLACVLVELLRVAHGPHGESEATSPSGAGAVLHQVRRACSSRQLHGDVI